MAYTTPRTWTDGELVTASIMNTHVRDNLNAIGEPVFVRKTADESVPTSTALQDDDHLFFAVGTSQVWFAQGWLMIDSPTAADFKAAFTVPASGTAAWAYSSSGDTAIASWGSVISSTTATALVAAGASLAAATGGGGVIVGVSLAGIFTTAGTAGNVRLQWAQSNASGTTTLKTNSFLMGRRLV